MYCIITFIYFCSVRKIIAYKSHFADFIKSLSAEERGKIARALSLFSTEDKIPSHFIKFIRNGLYEFRTNIRRGEVRIFFFYDNGTLVVLLNAILKKSQKTPEREIRKALKLKEEYYANK